MASSTDTFKKFLETTKTTTRVLGRAERHVLSRPLDDSRQRDVFHPSEMSKDTWCHRSTYFELMNIYPKKSKARHSLQTTMMFQNGHDIHAKWQNLFGEMGILYGTWGCWHQDCKARIWGMPYPDCPNGHGPLKKYKEVPLKLERLRFGGHADGWIVGCGNDLLLEIKSVGEGTFRWEAPGMLFDYENNWMKAWDALETPFYSHIMQAQIYLKLVDLLHVDGLIESPAPQEILFLYENKSNQTLKEFIIPKSDFGITEKFEAVDQILMHINNETVPVCNVKGAEKCKSCEGYDD